MDPHNLPTSRQLIADIAMEAMKLGLDMEIHTVVHQAGTWPLPWLVDPLPGLENGTFLLTATQHATEVAGAITVHRRLPEIVAATRSAGLRLACAPLICASGYDHRESGRDRNVDNDGGDAGPNDYLRYQLHDGTWTWLVEHHQPFKRWVRSSHPDVGERQPAETLVMHRILQRLDWSKVRIALDLHQDNLTKDALVGAYQYPFGDASRYAWIIERVGRIVPILGNHDIRFDRTDPDKITRTDERGCIVNFHDGSLSDLAYRRGVPHVLTTETIGATPLDAAVEVNTTWIRGLAGLAVR